MQCAPVTIRVVSNVETVTKFEQPPGVGQGSLSPASDGQHVIGKAFPYRSKCVLAFQVSSVCNQPWSWPPSSAAHPVSELGTCRQHVDGHEVCFFAMYVQEYGSDCPEPNTNRV